MAFTVKTAKKTTKTAAKSEEDEFAGIWLNIGVVTEDDDGAEEGEGNPHFNRLPRGIAVSDLDLHRVYASTHERNPEWAEEATIVNALIEKIREVGLTLEEGEARPVNLSVQLYRRQEQVEAVAGKAEVSVDLDALF